MIAAQAGIIKKLEQKTFGKEPIKYRYKDIAYNGHYTLDINIVTEYAQDTNICWRIK